MSGRSPTVVLHATADSRTLYVWGERISSRFRPRSRAGSPARSLDEDDLMRELRKARFGFRVYSSRPHKLRLGLPAVGEPPGRRGRPSDQVASSVAAYPLSPDESTVLLRVGMAREALASGPGLAPDLVFWTEVLRFAGSLVARCRYLPGLEVVDECPSRVASALEQLGKAVWTPVLDGRDAERFAALTRRTPPTAIADESLGSVSPEQAANVLRAFLARHVDCLVRAALSRDLGELGPGRKRRASDFDSLHDAWLHSLRSPLGLFWAEQKELQRLSDEIRAWRRPVDALENAPFQLCFRLEEPDTARECCEAGLQPPSADGEGAFWYVRCLLRPRDEPALLLPVDRAWNAREGSGSPLGATLGRAGGDLQEHLYTALGRATVVCPEIAAAMTTSPEGYPLDTQGAFAFLTRTAPALAEAGLGVMVPAWWTRSEPAPGLTARVQVKSPAMRGAGGLSLDDVVEVDWSLALGDTVLTPEELEFLARAQTPLVRLRGRWLEVGVCELLTAARLWERRAQTERATVRDVIRMAAGAGETAGDLPVRAVEATGWVGSLLQDLAAGPGYEELKPPKGFCGTLRPYQVRGYSWLALLAQWGLGACLADDMGLGKTVQVLALVQREWEANGSGGGRGPVLVVCPTSVVGNWRREAQRFAPRLPVMVHHGPDREKGQSFQKAAGRKALVVTSYSLLHRDAALLRKADWTGVILDEAQNIKNPETKQARVARALRARYRAALTGTPVENHVGDLWSIMQFLNPGLLGTQTEFKDRFFRPIQNGDADATERLRRVTGPFILRRVKTDKSIISDLPEKQEIKVFCHLTREQAALYAAVVSDLEERLASAEGISRRGLILAALSKLKQVCNHPAQFLGDGSTVRGRSGKLARLTEVLEEVVEVGDRALIFTHFTRMGRILRSYLQETFGHEVLYLHGGVPKAERDDMVRAFQETGGGPPLFILSLKAGGTGLNLTAANHVFHFDRWWNPAVEDQATDRAFRIGQRRGVFVHKLITAGTVEERIDEMTERKRGMAESVVGSGEAWLTELTDRAIREIVALGAEAVEDV